MDPLTKIERDLAVAIREGADCTDPHAQLEEAYAQNELDQDRNPTADGFREWLTGREGAERDALASKVRKIEALADLYAVESGVFIEKVAVASTIRTLLAD